MTLRGVIKTIIAVAIIAAGALIGWAVASSTNPYSTTTSAAAVSSAPSGTVVANTPLPTFTPAYPVTPGANGTAGAGTGTRGGQTGQGQTQRARPITGTVESYDATSKVLTVKDTEGKSQKFAVGSATLTKSEKLSADDFSKLLGNNSIVLVAGDKGADGTYNARSLTAVDISSFSAGGGAGANTTRGAGGNTTPGAGGNTTGGGGFGGAANALGGQVVVRGGTLADNKLTGSSFTGEAVTANVSADTSLLKQTTASLEDLKAGAAVSVTARAAQGDAPAEAQLIAIS